MNRSPIGRVLQPYSAVHKSRCGSVLAAVIVTTLTTLAAVAQVPAPSPAVRVLGPNAIRTERKEPGVNDVYELTLGPGQFAQISVDQLGIDLEVAVTEPVTSFSVRMDSPNGSYGTETVSLLSQAGGTYRIDIISGPLSPPGDYKLQVVGPHAPSASEKTVVSAEHAYVQAQKLRNSGPASYQQAIEKYQEAANLWQQAGDTRRQAYALVYIGRIHRLSKQFTPGIVQLDQANALLKQAGDLAGQAFALNEAGVTHRTLGSQCDALIPYEEALQIRINIGDRFGQAQIYNNLGLVHSYMGSYPRSVENYEKAVPIWQELGRRDQEIISLINSANARAEMGDVEVARSHYQTVLDFSNAELARDKSPLADVARRYKPFALNGLGLVHDTWANTDSALIHYQEALELFRNNNDESAVADVLNNIGMVYAFLGDAAQAIAHFQQALAIREQDADKRATGITLSNLGYALTLDGRHDEAREQLTRALSLNTGTCDRRFEAYTLQRLGMTYVGQNQPLKAVEEYKKALAIQREPSFGDRRGQAITLDKMAEAHFLSGQETEALKTYEKAIEHWKHVGDQQGQALSLFGIARIERARSNLANARDRAEEAIALVEKLRYRVTGHQLQMTYFAGKQDFYALAIDVRMQLYDAKKSPADLEAALALSEKARARNLLNLLADTDAELPKGISAEVGEKKRHLDLQISKLTQSLFRSRGIGVKEEIANIQRRLDAYLDEQDRLLASLKSSSDPARQTQPLSAKEIQQLLDDNTLLLQFQLDDKRSHLWAVTRSGIDYHPLAGRAEIENTADQLYQSLIERHEPQRSGETELAAVERQRAATVRYGKSAFELSRLILTGVAPALGKKRLVIVADGRLQFISFEALPLPESVASNNGSQHLNLLSHNEIVYEPSASALAVVRRTHRPPPIKTVAVLADPVFNEPANGSPSALRGKDTRLPSDNAKEKLARSLRDLGDEELPLQRLEFSLNEANAIAAVAPRGSWMKAVGYKANRALATSPLLKQFRIVHFATHGIVNDRNPELSGIVLSMFNERGQPEDGYLTLRDIHNLDLPVNLVVVSACQTGIGKPVRGEGLIALTRGFMNAGAKSVVVSLWRVGDDTTAELMKRFYRHMLGKNNLSPAAALRKAKIEMSQEYHPYYWSGFVLQGDWK